jgi:hypothetical protein
MYEGMKNLIVMILTSGFVFIIMKGIILADIVLVKRLCKNLWIAKN